MTRPQVAAHPAQPGAPANLEASADSTDRWVGSGEGWSSADWASSSTPPAEAPAPARPASTKKAARPAKKTAKRAPRSE